MSAQEWGLLAIKIAVALAGQWWAYLYGRHTMLRECEKKQADAREALRKHFRTIGGLGDSMSMSGVVTTASVDEYEQNLDKALRRAVENME